jgi:hypothetical protein
MPCYNPLSAWKVDGKIVFNQPSGSVGLLKPFNLPCAKCIGCRLNYARSWALRCQLEALTHEDNCFITLTFNNEELLKRTNPWSVDKNDFQLFMKKFRKRFNKQIRFFHCGEYGEKTYRPHYHALIFGHDFRIPSKTNKVKKYGSDKYPLFQSSELTKYDENGKIIGGLWPYGHTTVGELNFETASYTARYATKKIKGDVSKVHIDPLTNKVSEINDVYCTMSTANGLGYQAYQEFKHNWYGNDFIRNGNGIKMKPPRYFDKLYAEEFPKKFEAIKKARKDTLDYLDMNPKDPKTKRLKDIENVKLLKLKECLREIDA